VVAVWIQICVGLCVDGLDGDGLICCGSAVLQVWRVGVAEGLGRGLQTMVWDGDPFMSVRVRSPTPTGLCREEWVPWDSPLR
jgi:hypothetical protein